MFCCLLYVCGLSLNDSSHRQCSQSVPLTPIISTIPEFFFVIRYSAFRNIIVTIENAVVLEEERFHKRYRPTRPIASWRADPFPFAMDPWHICAMNDAVTWKNRSLQCVASFVLWRLFAQECYFQYSKYFQRSRKIQSYFPTTLGSFNTSFLTTLYIPPFLNLEVK